MTAPQAAGVIHSDFEKGFIRAETVSTINNFVDSIPYQIFILPSVSAQSDWMEAVFFFLLFGYILSVVLNIVLAPKEKFDHFASTTLAMFKKLD